MTTQQATVPSPDDTPDEPALIGPVQVGTVAHGGHCVARHDGRVVFVRHTLPGETVMVRLTDTSRKSFWRGDAVEVVTASPDRVEEPCPVARTCGGCDFQHVSPQGQRELKRAVVAEQLQHLAGIAWQGSVEAVEPLRGWRTRARFAVDHTGPAPRVGMREHRSHDLVELPSQGCLIAHPSVPGPDELRRLATQAGDEIRVVVDSDAQSHVVLDADDAAQLVLQRAAGHDFRVRADGFWQVHPQAADVLVNAVMEGLEPAAGEQALDLYCGVGLFAGALADRGLQVVGVEQVNRAVQQARRNVPRARFIAAPLARALRQLPKRTDLVVLDPPRTGAGEQVVRHLAGLGARRIAYVACDPASLARDLKTFAQVGYVATSIRAFDLFPMTHHVECVAVLERKG